MKTPPINPQILLFGAAAIAVLFLTYKTTKAAGNAVDSITGGIGDAANAVGTAAGNAWDGVTDFLWGQAPQYADIRLSDYTPTQVAKIMPARTVELYDSPATSPTFGGIANGDNTVYWTDPSTRIGVGPIGWQSTGSSTPDYADYTLLSGA